MASTSTTSDDPGGSNSNIMTEADKDKFYHLSKYYELTKIEAGKPRKLFFKCLQPECSTAKPKSCHEGSTTNILRHYERMHPHSLADFKKVYYTKLKRAADNSGGGGDPKQPKLPQSFFFKSNCTRDQLNDAIVDDIIETMAPFTSAERESFQRIVKLLDPNKKSGGLDHRTVVKIMVSFTYDFGTCHSMACTNLFYSEFQYL